MFYAIESLVEPGVEVIFPDPGFPIYESMTRFCGGTPVRLPIRQEHDFRIDLDELERLITPRTRLLIINSPANPTGGVFTRADVERIGELVLGHDLVVLADEIYGRIVYEGEHVSLASLPGLAERTIVLDGFSKTYAMTGWRLGYAIVPEPLLAPFSRLIINSVSCTSSFSQLAAVEALTGPQDTVEAMVEEFRARRIAGRRRAQRDPRVQLPDAGRCVLRLPGHLGDRAGRIGVRRPAARRDRGVRARRHRVRAGRWRPHPDQLRELAREPGRGAAADPRLRRGPVSRAGPGDGPRVFVARRIPAEGLDVVTAACAADVWEDELPPPRAELLRRIAGLRRRPDAPHGPGRRRVPRRGRARAEGRLELRGRLRQRGRGGVHAARDPGRQHARCPDRDDRGPGLGAADGHDAARCRGRSLRPRRPLADVGPELLLGGDVHGATLGIVGFGRIGQAVARRAAGFGMTVLYWDRSPKPPELERELEREPRGARRRCSPGPTS